MNRPNELQPADLGEILFQAAVAQGRADALKAAAKKAARELAHDPATLRMLESFAKMRKADQEFGIDKQTQAEVDAEMNYNLDRAEAMAINAGRY